MNPHVFEPGPPANHNPLGVQVGQAPAYPGPRNHPGVVRKPGQGREHRCRRGRQRHSPCSRLCVPKPQLSRLEVHVLPPERQDLIPPAPGQHQQPECGNPASRYFAFDFQLGSPRTRLTGCSRSWLRTPFGVSPIPSPALRTPETTTCGRCWPANQRHNWSRVTGRSWKTHRGASR